MGRDMLAMNGVCCYYGQGQVLHGTTLEVREGELVGLVGRNGVGKTTTLKAIMGMIPARAGSIAFRGEELTGVPAYRVPRRGISYVPQGRHLFPKLTVKENLEIACVTGETDPSKLEEIYGFFPRVKERLSQKAGTLSGGEQQMVAIGRALVAKPDLILLDEPTEGLMPLLVQTIAETVQAINERGISILLVEQNLKTLKEICHRIYIMEKGAIVYEGTPSEIDGAMDVQERYLSVKV
ncbi:ABC transporter ATP-binding protein [Candidatus Deferrimicrobium sp.]|uniref:ABC transporter ATP-binding protein n=1 Tax=Candidatus Deferrimicrobium sp. TaxID=3060586 RepID=UPI002ED43DEB